MKIARSARATYQTIFQGSEEDLQALVRFLLFLREDNSIQKIRKEPNFGASPFWVDLAGDLYVGFSSDKIILCSGYKYPGSLLIPDDCLKTDSLSHLLRFSVGKVRSYLRRGPNIAERRFELERIFKRFYRYDPRTLNPFLLENAHFSYLMALEAFSVLPPPRLDTAIPGSRRGECGYDCALRPRPTRDKIHCY